MSTSPLKSGASQPSSSASLSSSFKGHSGDGPLTVSQALIITAGMAGLIGLLSGIVIRFSLANSTHARFLSPLQTFPALSSWTPERPQGGTNMGDLPRGARSSDYSAQNVFPETLPSQRQETLPSAILEADGSDSTGFLRRGREEPSDRLLEATRNTTGVNFAAPVTFDEFADRDAFGRRMVDPWEALKAGPKLSEAINPTEVDPNYFTEGFYPEVEEVIADDGSYYR